MSSPTRKSSPNKKRGRPTTAQSPHKSYAAAAPQVELGPSSQMNIIVELNNQEIVDQNKDIEIERLKTTCFSLNNKVSVTEDL